MSYYRKQPLNSNKKLQAYIIGVALGDGNLSNPNKRAIRLRITCDKKYPLLIEYIKSCLSLLLPNNKISIVNHKNCIDISIYSNYWDKLLWKWDKGPKDLQNVSVPQWIKDNKSYIKEALRGLLQTDGSIYKDRNYTMVNFVSTTTALSNDVFNMIEKLGYYPNMQKLKQKNGKIKHTIRIAKNSEKFIKEIEENYNKALVSDVWEKLNLDKNNLKNLGQFYQKRQELKATVDLLRLNNLSNKLIAINKIVEKEGKKGGESITSVVDNLKKFFKDSPLLLDLKNVEFALKEKIDFGEKRRLAMILSDNPQMLWQAGKYPSGNGSCQHYAEGSHANRLMGYVGDANCKVSYLIDLNKLPVDIKKELDEKGFEEIKDKIPTKDLLNASFARSMVKMVKDKDSKPVILVEPTYTVVYKGDVSMDKYYNIFIDLMLADPMNAKIARGGGSDEVIKGRSRSPESQYEDLDLNSVKFVHKSSSPTKQEMEVMERIRSSR